MISHQSIHFVKLVLALGVCGFAISLSGCDRIEASKHPTTVGSGENASLTQSSSAEVVTTPALTTSANPVGSDMESLGPDSTRRIYYQFVDGSGRVQFVERLSDVPQTWRKQVGFVEMSQPPPLTPVAARRSWTVSADRTTKILAARPTPLSPGTPSRKTQSEEVILYFANWCGYCKRAQAHLDRAGVEYELRNVDNEAVSRELREKTGRGGIPVLDFSGEILRGYSADQYDIIIRDIQS